MLKQWCFPQYLLFLLLKIILKATFYEKYEGKEIWTFNKEKYPYFSGAALFHTLLPDTQKDNQLTIQHEHGHHLQGNKWGPLYLLAVGIPSLINNFRSRKNQWVSENYYLLYPEKQADRLGGLSYIDGKRIYNAEKNINLTTL